MHFSKRKKESSIYNYCNTTCCFDTNITFADIQTNNNINYLTNVLDNMI